ncbi:unnamed protein product [Arctia plantaginis]|uniref:Uncharacterized protein n=1 Tax=Arctia plantaginis TaxID=874455 RepID=A0A8S1B2N1_ARCPL|nr:unnamed protein product [Arctia plantaginis]
MPAAPGTAGRADAGRGARTLCLIKFIRGNKTVSRDCASCGVEGCARGRMDQPGRQLRRICRAHLNLYYMPRLKVPTSCN